MNEYIALTAQESHWRGPENTRFIGEWCKVDTRQHVWSAYNTEVLSRRWLTSEEYERAMAYVVPLGKRLADALGRRLEQQYSLGMDARFYYKMLAPWAINFTSVLYDRYLAVKDAATACPAAFFLTGHNPEDISPAYNLNSFTVDLSRSDKNNLQLFSLIANYLHLSCESAFCQWEQRECSIAERPYASEKVRLFHTAFYSLNRLLKREFYVVNSLYHRVFRKDLLQKTRFRVLHDEIHGWPKIAVDIDRNLRGRELDLQGDEFVSLLAYCAPRYLPWGLGEGMPEHIQVARNHPAIRAGAFLSCFIPYGNLPAQYVSVLSNAPVAMYLHSGKNLTRSILADIENSYADIHFDAGDTQTTLPNPAFIFEQNPSDVPNDHVLLIISTLYRYFFRLGYSCSLFKDLAKNTFIPFVNELAPSIPITVRPFMHTYGWEFVDWEKQFSHITIQNPKTMPFASAMAQAKILVAPCCWFSKVSYDALACNKPAILIQQKQIQPFIPGMENIVTALEEGGILFTDAVSAAQKINAVYDNAEGWWKSEKVQKARKIFVDAILPSSRDWEKEWLTALRKLSRIKQ